MSTALKLTVAEYDTMVNKGAFDELTQKIELINGEIHAMNPAGPVHDHIIEYLTLWSVQNTDCSRIRVRIQSGLSLPELDSRPEPDVLWVRADHPRERHPVAAEVLLLIEVSHSSLPVDRELKGELYARAGIVECWIIDIANEQIHVYQQPDGSQYQLQATIKCGESVAPLAQSEAILLPALMFNDSP